MWATSGRSMRRAPSLLDEQSRRGGHRGLIQPADDREHRHPELAEPARGGRVEHDRLAAHLLLGVRLEGHLAHQVASERRRATRGLADPVDPDLHLVVGQRSPVTSLLERLAARERRCLLGRLLPLEPGQAAAHPGDPGHPVRILERRVQHDLSCPRAAHEHRAPDLRRIEHGHEVSAVRERHVGRLAAPETAGVVPGDPVLRNERVPLGVPHPRVGDAGVDEHDRAPVARPLRPEAPAGNVDQAFEVAHASLPRSRWTAPASGRRQWVMDIAWS